MKDLNKSRFEEEWRKAFEEAELPPNNDVWARLDAHLANQESRKYKNRLVWFQRIAAGVLLLLLGSGAWLWMSRQAASPQLTQGATQTDSMGSEMARTHSGTESLPTETTSPAERSADDLTTKNTVGSRSREQQVPSPVISPDATVKARTSTTGPLAGEAGQNVVDPSNDPVLTNKDHSGTSSSNSSRAKRSRQAVTGNNDAYLAHGGRNVKSGLNDAGETANYPRTPHTPAESVVKKESVSKEAHIGGTPNGRLAVAGITPKTLLAQEPVIRPRSILPHLSEAYWAKVTTEDEKVAQKTDAKRDRWQIGLAFAPGAYQPNFRINESSSAFMSAMSNISAANGSTRLDASALSVANRDLETATAQGLSYQTGLRLEYALSRRFSVQSGVDYLYNSSRVNIDSYISNAMNGRNELAFASILNYENQTRAEALTLADAPASVDYGSAFYNVNGKILTEAQPFIPVQNVYEYVGIPIRVNYQLLTKKLGATLGAGVSGDVFLSNRFGNEEREIDEVRITSVKGTAYRKLGISAWLGLKMQYRFARKYSVFLEPSYRMAITSFTNTPALQSRPSLFGVGTGLQMLF